MTSQTIELSLPTGISCEHPHLQIAFETALLAAEVVRAAYGQVGRINEKEPGQLVTEIDLKADKLISSKLREATPDIAIVSEESFQGGSLPVGDAWYVDPIDGTAAFVFHTQPEIPAVMLALQEGSEITLSVVCFPLTGEWCYAVKGQGAFDQVGRKLQMPGDDLTLNEALVALNPQHDISKESLEFSSLCRALRSETGCRQTVSILPHSTLALRMAMGQSPVAVLIHDNSEDCQKQGPWDIAPISLIVEEAGGLFLGLDGKPYNLKVPSLIVIPCNQNLASKIFSFV